MIDLHCHILPGLDDGARDLGEALEMARLAAESGVRAVAATPHCTQGQALEVWSGVKMLRAALREAGIPLHVFMGMEIFGTSETLELLRDNRLFTLNSSRYPLIEFSFRSDGETETEILWELVRGGYRPLVAHPERYEYIRNDPEMVNEWKRMGCLFQVNRGSLLGRFGTGPRQMAEALVERGFASVVASDAHSPEVRTPWMADVRELIAERISPTAAEFLLTRNSLTIIRNEELPPVSPEWF